MGLICLTKFLQIEFNNKSLPAKASIDLLPFNPFLFDKIGGMELSTMDQNGDCTVTRAWSSATATTASSRMSRFGKNKAYFCLSQNKVSQEVLFSLQGLIKNYWHWCHPC